MKDILASMLDFTIISQFFDADSEDLNIDELDLVSFTPGEFEIQITFKNTASISPSLTEPDIVEIRIKKSDFFIDAESFKPIDPNFVMRVNLPPQVTIAEAAELEAMNEEIEGPMKYLSAA